MQRFTVALFALVAIFALVFPTIDARSSGLRRMDTNAARLRRGEGIMPPTNLKRHAPSKVEAAKRNQPSKGPGGPPGPPGNSGSIQCRGNDGKTIGYIGSGGTVKRGSSGGASCSYSRSTGKISTGGFYLGAFGGRSAPKTGFSIDFSAGLKEEECAITWDVDVSTGKMTPSYIDTTGKKVECGVSIDEASGALKFSTEIDARSSVSLHFIQ